MQPTLENFVRALRGHDVPVSLRESIEAAELVTRIGYGDRDLLKNALAVTLAKSAEEKAAFDDCFELFFTRQAPAAPPPVDADENDADSDAEGAGGDLLDLVRQGDAQALAAAMEQTAGEIGAADIQFSTQRGFLARRLLDRMGLRDLERQIAAQRAGADSSGGGAEALEAARRFLLDEARQLIDRQFQLYAAQNAEKIREEFLEIARLGAVDRRDFHRMHRIVRRMAKRLAQRHSHRRRRYKRGQLDVRRTLRKSLPHDGVPFDIVWKTRKLDRPKVVVICDVSRSVAAVARFLLLFLYSLHDVIPDIDSYAFSDRLVDIGDILDEEGVETAIEQVLNRIGFRPTDYGQALEDFEEQFIANVDRRTTVLIMGDGRSNDTDPKSEILQRVATRSKRMIWLNPEPEAFWGLGDSEMPRYRPHCHLARTCNTVKHLERVVDDLLRSYNG
ncbi:MAG: VWA domain-containing protein [Alphaproteobacteria bacterium]